MPSPNASKLKMQFSQEICKGEGCSEIEREKILGGLSKKLEGIKPDGWSVNL